MLWSGLLLFLLVETLRSGAVAEGIFVIGLLAALGFVLFMTSLAWGLADEVYDCGDFLLVKKRGQEDGEPALASRGSMSATSS